MEIEKTVYFPVDGKQVPVSELPTPIRKQFELLDAFRKEQMDLTVKLTMATTAVQVKSLELTEVVRKIITPAEPEGEASSTNG